jgi:transcriptional regulator with XRE-family HTH domain
MKDRIEKILRCEQISSSKFADEIGVQRSSISHLFTGRNNPSLELVQKILNRFTNLNPEWLLTGKGEMYKKTMQQSLFSNIPEPDKIPDSIIENRENAETEKKTEELSNNYKNENIIEKPENKNIEKIIVLYTDNSFREFVPS